MEDGGMEGCVAQLVEHRAFNLMAAGSSPATPKKGEVAERLKAAAC
jgi:hypothetical protein